MSIAKRRCIIANRYAILPAATTSLWSATSTWSASSGGATGASVPTSADNVFIDALSVAGANAILSVDATAACLDMDWTGATNSPTFAGSSRLNLYGSLTFIAAMTQTYSGALYFTATSIGKTVTVAGTLSCGFWFAGDGGGWTLQDNLSFTNGPVYHDAGTLNTNGKTITCTGFYVGSGGYTRHLTLGASIINCTSWSFGNALTFDEGTSSIRVSGTGAFAGGGETYYEVQLNGTAHTISGSNTFTNLIFKADTTQTITFTDGTTQVITNPTITGSVGKVKTLQGTSTAGWNLTATRIDYISLDYLSISYSKANPANVWFAGIHSTDGGNNTDWFFIASPSRSAGWWILSR